jgi:hypothetical protein
MARWSLYKRVWVSHESDCIVHAYTHTHIHGMYCICIVRVGVVLGRNLPERKDEGGRKGAINRAYFARCMRCANYSASELADIISVSE